MSDEVTYQPDVAAIATDLTDDHIHVDADLADVISSEQVAAITETVASSDTALFVLAVPLNYRSDLSANQLVSLVHREAPRDGIYFVSYGSVEFGWSVQTTSYGVNDGREASLGAAAASQRYPTDLGLQLLDAVELFTSGEARPAWEAVYGDSRAGAGSTAEDNPSQVLGLDAPLIAAGLVGVLVVAVIARAVRRRRVVRGEVRLDRRALRRISSAQTDDWRHRAEIETGALGERIRTTEIDQGADREAWQSALDHYQTATAVLDRSTKATDSIGALVLARRGDDALDHAVAGKRWTPTAACFFNPLHGAATTKAAWVTSAGTRKVPCCAACRRDVRRRLEPEILDVPNDTTVVHYMDSGDEPWASTGYGALAPDLIDRVVRRS